MKNINNSESYTSKHPLNSSHSLIKKTLIAALVFAASSFLPSRADAKIIERIAAQVNKSIFTLYDISLVAPIYLLIRQESPQQLEDPSFFRTIQYAVLQDMVDRKLYEDDAKTSNVTVSDSELDIYLAKMREQQGFSSEQQQASALEQFGVNFEQFKIYARSEILKMRLMRIKMGTGVTISDNDVEQRYKQITGKSSDLIPFIDVSHILFSPADDTVEAKEDALKRAKDALKRIRDGEDFASVAREVSNDSPSASQGGHIGKVHKSELLPGFADVAFSLPVGKVSDIVQSSIGYHIILVSKKGDEPDLNAAKLKDRIRFELMAEKQASSYKEYIEKLRQRGFIDIKLPKS